MQWFQSDCYGTCTSIHGYTEPPATCVATQTTGAAHVSPVTCRTYRNMILKESENGTDQPPQRGIKVSLESATKSVSTNLTRTLTRLSSSKRNVTRWTQPYQSPTIFRHHVPAASHRQDRRSLHVRYGRSHYRTGSRSPLPSVP